MNYPKTEPEQNSCAICNSVCKYKVLLLESIRPFQTFSDSSLSILGAHRKPEEELCGAFVKLSDLHSLFAAYLPTSTRLGWQPEWRNVRPLCRAGACNKTQPAVRAGPNNPSYVFFSLNRVLISALRNLFWNAETRWKKYIDDSPRSRWDRKKNCFLCWFIQRWLFMITCLWYFIKMHIYSQNCRCDTKQRTLGERERLFSGRVSGWKTTAP